MFWISKINDDSTLKRSVKLRKNSMSDKSKISKDDLIEAIKRSGYLLESEIANTLAISDFFIESNQVIEDPITGKSREIDLIAEYRSYGSGVLGKYGACAKIKFVFEIKNNIYPLVLMTKFEFSPNIEIWESTKEIQTVPEGITCSSTDSFYGILLTNDEPIFTQYCSFDEKKGSKNKELLATHPEQVYTGLSKITQYCEEAVESWENIEEQVEYYRRFLYMPVLLINDDLFELEVIHGNDPILHKVEESKLVFNYYYKKNPRIATVWVVTKEGFKGFINKMIEAEGKLEAEMITIINKKDKD
jgi:hypothetical protein